MKEKTFYKVIEVHFFNGETYVTECADNLIIELQLQKKYAKMLETIRLQMLENEKEKEDE